ncbi:MAG: sugar phosphate isomerase/epimerase family protein [Candidatus Latescibacterota bacterium]
MIRLSYMITGRLASFRPASRLREALVWLRDTGYQGVELNLSEPPGVDPDELAGWLQDLGLAIPAFLTGEAYSEGLCLCSPDPQVRERTVARLTAYLDTARRFRALLVVGLLQGLCRDEPDEGVAQERIAAGLRAVAAAAEGRDVTLVVEPVNHLQVGFNHTVAEVRRLIARVGSTALRPMVDTLHLNIEETSLVGPIRALGTHLRHVHLCESNGAAFGSGHVDFRAVWQALEEAGYDGFASVKVYRRATLAEGARSALQHLRDLGLR